MTFARDPKTLEEAFKIILDARHQHYTQYGPAKRGYLTRNLRTNFSNNYNDHNSNSEETILFKY